MIAHLILWTKMKVWQWRNGAPAPKEKVDMLLLRYGNEHNRIFRKIDTTDQVNFETDEELLRALARKHIAQLKQFEQFEKGLKRTATTTEGKAALAEVYWILATNRDSSWDYTLAGVKERRVWREETGPEIKRLGLESRVQFGFAPWYEHVEYWYKKVFSRRYK
jgi:hypothetical protein